MTSTNNQWHSTDEEQVVPVRAATPSVSAEALPAKRLPAAIIGMALMLTLGGSLFVYRSTDTRGQLTEDPNDIEIELTDSGAKPAEVDVEAGKTIVWINNSSIPHILESETLEDEDGQLLQTPAIFPGSEFSFTLAADATLEMHEYESKTSPSVVGSITIVGVTGGIPIPTTIPSTIEGSSTQISSSAAPSIPSQISGTIGNTETPSSATTTIPSVQQTGIIPSNPFTVANNTAVIPGETKAANTTVTASVTEHTPTMQPESGMGAWLAGIALLASFAFVWRRASKA